MAQKEKHEYQDFEVDVDMTEVQAFGGGGYQLAPEGEWLLRVVDMEKRSSTNNNPMITVTFEIEDEGEHYGTKVWNNYSLQPKAIGRLKQFSMACRAQIDRFVSSQHINQVIRATIIHVEGQASVGADGQALPPRTFANVCNEMPLEGEDEEDAQEVQQEVAPPAKAPVMRGGGNKTARNGAPRRA
jgi:hypothetical protein